MARATPTAGSVRGPTVHNDGSVPVTIRVIVHDRTVAAESVTLAPRATAPVAADATASIEVHADGGSATAPAHTNPSFVVRDRSVILSPE